LCANADAGCEFMDDTIDANTPRQGEEMSLGGRGTGAAAPAVRIEKVLGRSGSVWAVQANGGRVYLVERDPVSSGTEPRWVGRVV
jgi:hypothetical protein